MAAPGEHDGRGIRDEVDGQPACRGCPAQVALTVERDAFDAAVPDDELAFRSRQRVETCGRLAGGQAAHAGWGWQGKGGWPREWPGQTIERLDVLGVGVRAELIVRKEPLVMR